MAGITCSLLLFLYFSLSFSFFFFFLVLVLLFPLCFQLLRRSNVTRKRGSQWPQNKQVKGRQNKNRRGNTRLCIPASLPHQNILPSRVVWAASGGGGVSACRERSAYRLPAPSKSTNSGRLWSAPRVSRKSSQTGLRTRPLPTNPTRRLLSLPRGVLLSLPPLPSTIPFYSSSVPLSCTCLSVSWSLFRCNCSISLSSPSSLFVPPFISCFFFLISDNPFSLCANLNFSSAAEDVKIHPSPLAFLPDLLAM